MNKAKMKTKILYIESAKSVGGSLEVLSNYISLMNKSIYEITVILYHKEAYDYLNDLFANKEKVCLHLLKDFGREKIEKIEQLLGAYIKNKQTKKLFSIFFAVSKVLICEIPLAVRLIHFLFRNRVDIIHINNDIYNHMAAIFSSRICKIPCVCHVRVTRAKVTKREKFLAKLMKQIIVLSETNKTNFMRCGVTNVTKIYDGVDLNKFRPSENKKNIVSVRGKHVFRIGYIGRITYVKGIEHFVSAAGLLQKIRNNIEFFIVGKAKREEKQYENNIFSNAKQLLGDKIKLFGWVEDVSKVLQGIDVVVIPTTSLILEGFNLVIAEAMAMEKLIIVTKVGAMPEVAGNCGVVIPPDNPEAIVNAVLKLIENPSLRQGLIENGRKRAEENFNIKKVIGKIEKIYIKVLKNNKCLSKNAVTSESSIIGSEKIIGYSDN